MISHAAPSPSCHSAPDHSSVAATAATPADSTATCHRATVRPERPAQPAETAAAKIEAENPSARLYKWTLAPGATTITHTHERPYLIISATPLVLKMTGADGKSVTHEVTAGDFHWIDAKVTHSLANAGTTPGTIVEIELK